MYLDFRILAMKEKGLIDRYKKKTNIIDGLNCDISIKHYRADLGIMDVMTAVIVLCTGFVLCLGFLISEFAFFTCFCKEYYVFFK